MRSACIRYAALAVLCIVVQQSHAYSSQSAQIRVRCDQDLGVVNRRIFGNNLIGYDPATYENWTKEYWGYADYGAGIWDPQNGQPVQEVIALAQEAGVTVTRFPGGCGSHHYDWKKTVGRDRAHFRYGIDEYMRTTEAIGAEPVITVSYGTGDQNDAADLVEYLNAPVGSNANGSTDWAQTRSDNGHAQPYNVKYFEIGNEEWHGDHRSISSVTPQAYAARYLKYYDAMKAVDPSVNIGVILYTPQWNEAVLTVIKDKLDFGIVHLYPDAGVDARLLQDMPATDVFKLAFSGIKNRDEAYLLQLQQLARVKANKSVPIAMTEYNAGFVGNEPVPYRFTLGAALLNAEFLRVMMIPEHNVCLAAYWQFCNSYWGMVYTQDDYAAPGHRQSGAYCKRPSYFVYEMYRKYFKERLVGVDVACDSYAIDGLVPSSGIGGIKHAIKNMMKRQSAPAHVQALSVNASISADKKQLGVMIVNNNMEQDTPCSVSPDGFAQGFRARAYVLTADTIDAMNEQCSDTVSPRELPVRIADNAVQITLPKHSFTAVEIVQGDIGE